MAQIIIVTIRGKLLCQLFSPLFFIPTPPTKKIVYLKSFRLQTNHLENYHIMTYGQPGSLVIS